MKAWTNFLADSMLRFFLTRLILKIIIKITSSCWYICRFSSPVCRTMFWYYKECGKCFSQSQNLKRHEKVHSRKHSYKRNRNESVSKGLPCKSKRAVSNVRIRFTNATPTQRETGDNRIEDQRSDIIERHTCWICQEEMSSESLRLQHYENHMRYIPSGGS